MRPLQAIRWLPHIENQWPRTESYKSARREPRSKAEFTFAVCGLATTGRFFVEISSTVDVSNSGCCLWLRTRPQTDSALALRAVAGGTALPPGVSQILLQPAWVRPEAGGWLVGAFALGQGGFFPGPDIPGSGSLVFPPHTP